jgi:hypothetical protein
LQTEVGSSSSAAVISFFFLCARPLIKSAHPPPPLPCPNERTAGSRQGLLFMVEYFFICVTFIYFLHVLSLFSAAHRFGSQHQQKSLSEKCSKKVDVCIRKTIHPGGLLKKKMLMRNSSLIFYPVCSGFGSRRLKTDFLHESVQFVPQN